MILFAKGCSVVSYFILFIILCAYFVFEVCCGMPSKEAKKRKYGKNYHAANKEKLSAYSKCYSKEHDRKEYITNYYFGFVL